MSEEPRFNGEPRHDLVSLRDYEAVLWRAHEEVHSREREERNRLGSELREKFAQTNEWRDQLKAERISFVTESTYQARHDDLLRRLDKLESAIEVLTNQAASANGRLLGAGTVLMALASGLGFVLARVFH